MKKLTLSIITLIVCSVTYGQNDHKKLPSLGVHFSLFDFQTASEVRSSGLGNVVRDKQWQRSKRMLPGITLSYVQGLNNKFDLNASLAGCFGEYPVPGKQAVIAQKLILEGAVTGSLKLLTDKYYINPFITAGIGGSKYKGYYAAFIPIGAGMQIKLTDNIFIVANSQYRVAVTENSAYHFYHSLGVIAPIKKKS